MKAIGTLVCMVLVVVLSFGTPSYLMAAETYPAKPVRIIVPFAPGGFVDFMARIIAGPMGQAIGQQVIVDNRPGAGGTLGAEIVARAKPDGYTLLIMPSSLSVINPAFYTDLRYDVLRDFQPIARLAESPSILTVHPSLPVKSVKDLLALARSKPEQIKCGTTGFGSLLHISAALFEHLSGVKFLQVPYGGGGPVAIALISGEIDMMFATTASVVSFIESGKLRGLAITSAQRSNLLPGFPTVAESGLPRYEFVNWLGIFAPAGTPRAVVEKLSNAVIRSVGLLKVVEGLQKNGADPVPLGPDELAPFMKKELEQWAKVFKTKDIIPK